VIHLHCYCDPHVRAFTRRNEPTPRNNPKRAVIPWFDKPNLESIVPGKKTNEIKI
jgi:hypothetical protein